MDVWVAEERVLDSKERYIERTSSKIEDEDIAFAGNFSSKTVGDRSSRRLVDDSENVLPERVAASFVACLRESLKYAGKVTRVLLMVVPR
jgi:hypothetical protein